MSANVRSVSRGRFRLLRKNIQRELGAALRASTFPFVSGVPLQLCDIAELTAAYALWSQRHWAFVLTYYRGLVLSSQALITPDIGTRRRRHAGFPPPSVSTRSLRSTRSSCGP